MATKKKSITKKAVRVRKTKPVTIARITQAYKVTGLKPLNKQFFLQEEGDKEAFNAWHAGKRNVKWHGHACALMALSIAESYTQNVDDLDCLMDTDGPDLANYLQLPPSFVEGFIQGFDSKITVKAAQKEVDATDPEEVDEDYLEQDKGYLLGVQARAAIIKPRSRLND